MKRKNHNRGATSGSQENETTAEMIDARIIRRSK